MSASLARSWYSEAMHGNGDKTSINQSYRLPGAVLKIAVREGALARNPWQIPGAGTAQAKRRPVASPTEISALVDEVRGPYKAVLLAAWRGLRRSWRL
jgi:hypothetical protein